MEECQGRWKLLRNKFVRELKKVKENKTGTQGPDYVSCWPYFDTLLQKLCTTESELYSSETNFSMILSQDSNQHAQP